MSFFLKYIRSNVHSINRTNINFVRTQKIICRKLLFYKCRKNLWLQTLYYVVQEDTQLFFFQKFFQYFIFRRFHPNFCHVGVYRTTFQNFAKNNRLCTWYRTRYCTLCLKKKKISRKNETMNDHFLAIAKCHLVINNQVLWYFFAIA